MVSLKETEFTEIPPEKDRIDQMIDESLPYFPEDNKKEFSQIIKNSFKISGNTNPENWIKETAAKDKEIIMTGVDELNDLKKHKIFNWGYDGFMTVKVLPSKNDNETIFLWPSSEDKKLYKTSCIDGQEICVEANNLEIINYLPFLEKQIKEIRELVASYYDLVS